MILLGTTIPALFTKFQILKGFRKAPEELMRKQRHVKD